MLTAPDQSSSFVGSSYASTSTGNEESDPAFNDAQVSNMENGAKGRGNDNDSQLQTVET
jgi:hypothetical protein